MTRRQVGLFGGSFNPPHICHTLASVWALQTTAMDELWWAPTYKHAFGKELVSFEERVELCELATRGLEQVSVSQIERELGGESRTVDTVKALRQRHEDCDFWLVVGADILQETHKWKDWEGLMAMVRLVVVGRAGYVHEAASSELTAGKEQQAQPLFSLPAVSSTAIREALARGVDAPILTNWVAHDVLARIGEKNLYRPASQ